MGECLGYKLVLEIDIGLNYGTGSKYTGLVKGKAMGADGTCCPVVMVEWVEYLNKPTGS